MTKRAFTLEQDKEVVRLYLAGYATRKIAELFNCEKSAVSNALQREGVSRRTNRDLADGEEAQIAKIYQAGYSIPRIARAYGKSGGLIHDAVLRQGGELRDDRFDFCEAEEVEIVKIYLAGHNMRDIARAYGCKSGTIRKALDRQGIRTREQEYQDIVKPRDVAISSLYNGGMSLSDISGQVELSESVVYKSLLRKGVAIRPFRKNFFNEHTFDDLNNELVLYWLGFAYADASLGHHELRFELAVKDLEHLKKFSEFMNGSVEVKYNHRACSAGFFSHHMGIRLQGLGLVARRSHFDKLKNEIPIGLEHHFIRGYIDGDGCISNRESVIILGQADILNWIKEMFIKHAQVGEKVVPRQRQGILEISWGGRHQFIRIVDYIYRGATVYLERKKERADKVKRG